MYLLFPGSEGPGALQHDSLSQDNLDEVAMLMRMAGGQPGSPIATYPGSLVIGAATLLVKSI